MNIWNFSDIAKVASRLVWKKQSGRPFVKISNVSFQYYLLMKYYTQGHGIYMLKALIC